MNELPTIECNCWDSDLGFGQVCKNCKVLLAHEAHAKEMIDEWEKSDMHGKTLNEWRGYLKAIQALKGEVKK